MKAVGSILGTILSALVVIGVIKGIFDANLGVDSLGDIAISVIQGVADLTIYLLPTLVEAVKGVTDNI